MATIHHLRPVKSTLKVLKRAAPQDRSGSADESEHAGSPAALLCMNSTECSFIPKPPGPYVSGCAGPTCGDRRRLCIIRDSEDDPRTEHLSKSGRAALCVFGRFGFNRCRVPWPHLSPRPRATHDLPDPLCHHRIN